MENQVLPRKPYPTDVSDEEWAFVAPYLSLMTEAAPQRVHDLREVYQCPAVDRARRGALAVAAWRPAAVARGLPADPALDRGGLF